MSGGLQPGAQICVVGGGIIGVCCAAELAHAGYQVTVIGRGAPGMAGASRANAGHIAAASILPLASPQRIRAMGHLLFSRASPLAIPLHNLAAVSPWLFRFALCCRQARYMAGVRALAALGSMVWETTENLYARAGIGGELRKSGALFVYETQKSFNAALAGWRLSQKYGVDWEVIGDLQALEPALSTPRAGAVPIAGIVRTSAWGVVSDPLKIVQAIANYAAATAVRFMRADVNGLAMQADSVDIHTDNSPPIRADALVIAAGAWSGALARQLGDRLPVAAGRGYNITFPGQSARFKHPLVLADRGMVVSSLSAGLRIGGLDELGGLTRPPDPQLFDRVAEVARALAPDLRAHNATQWMGHRPATPDSVPIIGRSGRSRRIFYACGHGHSGLTQAPATARIIADLVSAKTPPIDPSPFSPARWRWAW